MITQTSDIHSTIRTLSDNFESTFSIGDVTKISGFYTENAMLLPSGFDFVKGKQDIKEFWQSAIDMGIKFIKIDIIEIEQHNDTAIEMSNYTLSGSDKQVIDAGKGIVIWKNAGDAWKMHRDIWNSSLEQQ
jgi:ketosteroid isomerase-like protein